MVNRVQSFNRKVNLASEVCVTLSSIESLPADPSQTKYYHQISAQAFHSLSCLVNFLYFNLNVKQPEEAFCKQKRWELQFLLALRFMPWIL